MQQLNGKDKLEEKNHELEEMNPMQTILFSQMIIKAWNNYTLLKENKAKENVNSKIQLLKKERLADNDDVDSYLNSCGSI